MRRHRVTKRGAPTIDSFFDEHDVFDVLIALYLTSVFGARLPGGKLRDQLPAFAVEHAHALALRRSERGTRSSSKGRAGELAALDEAARTAVANVFRPGEWQRPPQDDDATWRSRMALQSWQLFSYDPGPLNPEIARLRDLFDPFEEELRVGLGFTAREAEALLNAFNGLTTIGLAHYFGLPVGDDHPDPSLSLPKHFEEGRAGRVVPRGLGDHTSYNLAMLELYASTFAAHHLELADVPVPVVQAFVERFSLRFGDLSDPADLMRRLWGVRDRPLLFDERSYRYFLSVPYNLVHAVAPVFESCLREQAGGRNARYVKAKGRLVEAESLGGLSAFLQPDGVWRSLEYVPVGATQPAEGDGLVIIDSVALVVEAKAVELSASARMGEPKALADKLSAAAVEAAEQCQRTIAALASGASVTGVTPSNVREAISIPPGVRTLPLVVTLESLGGITAALWQLLTVPPGMAWPVVVNIDDLHWFMAETPLVAELLHYLVVRQRLSETEEISAPDEADWFCIYRLGGAHAFSERLAFLSQFKSKAAYFVGTERRRGHQLEAPSHPFEAMLHDLQSARPAGWLEASFALLERDLDEAREINRWMRALADTRRRGSKLLAPPQEDVTPLRISVSEPAATSAQMELVVGFDLRLVALVEPL